MFRKPSFSYSPVDFFTAPLREKSVDYSVSCSCVDHYFYSCNKTGTNSTNLVGRVLRVALFCFKGKGKENGFSLFTGARQSHYLAVTW